MKYLLVALVVVVVLWLMLRSRAGGASAGRQRGKRKADPVVPCAHCGLHVPRSEAALDAGGRAYCNAAHRLAGPR